VISETDIVKLGLFIFTNLATIRGPHWNPNIQALELMAGPLSNRLDKLPKGAKQKIDDATDIIFLVLGAVMLLATPIKTEIALLSQLGKTKNNEQTNRGPIQTNYAQSNGKPTGAESGKVTPGISAGLAGAGDRD
jgi:hypothetical protein